MTIPTSASHQTWADAFMTGIPYAVASGMKVTELGKGTVSLYLPAREAWTGDADLQMIHTGCLSALADSACGLAVGAAMDTPEPIATLDLRMDYLRPAMANSELVCKAECYRLSRSIGFVRGHVFQIGQDEPVATVNATFMRATANTRRKDMSEPGTATTDVTPTLAAARLSAPASIEPSRIWVSQRADVPESLALPPGRSPYVDFLNIHQQMQIDAGPIFRLPFKRELIGNPMLPALHGGVLAGFGETAMILHLTNTNPAITGVPLGIDFAIAYMRSAKPVDTFVQGTTVRQGNRVALVQVSIWQDDPQRPVAQARGHCLMPRDDR
jgi:uncharacterized protein (TIGR00369 family)